MPKNIKIAGHLSSEDVLHVCRSYDAVFSLGLSESRVRGVIGATVEAKEGEVLVNVETFCQALEETLGENQI